MPADLFTKSLFTQKKTLQSFEEVYGLLKGLNPDLKIIVTVSPVRHIKDTLTLNTVSKSVLRLACDTLASNFKDVFYFPSYEIMIDDLRDYRFYKADMIHPTDEAEDYIWGKFIASYATDTLQKFIHEWKVLQAALGHKSFHPRTSAHQAFLKDTLRKLEALKNQVNVDDEINFIKSQQIES